MTIFANTKKSEIMKLKHTFFYVANLIHFGQAV